MAYDNEANVRKAYHTAEGNVLDIPGWIGSFTEDGVFNNITGFPLAHLGFTLRHLRPPRGHQSSRSLSTGLYLACCSLKCGVPAIRT